MPRRFTVTEKWSDPWLMKRRPRAKLLFNYLCDSCDIAGFWEVNYKLAATQTGLRKICVWLALRELRRCYVRRGRWVWMRNFLKHQKNLPLNRKNPAHRGIIAILNSHPDFEKEIKYLLEPSYIGTPLFDKIKGATKGLRSPIGKGIGKGNWGGVGGSIVKLCKTCGKSLFIGRNGKEHCSGNCDE